VTDSLLKRLSSLFARQGHVLHFFGGDDDEAFIETDQSDAMLYQSSEVMNKSSVDYRVI
jgi:hypothetical protein